MTKVQELVDQLHKYRDAYLQTPGAEGTVTVLTDAIAEIQSTHHKLSKAEWALSDIDNLFNENILWDTFGHKTRAILDNHYERKS